MVSDKKTRERVFSCFLLFLCRVPLASRGTPGTGQTKEKFLSCPRPCTYNVCGTPPFRAFFECLFIVFVCFAFLSGEIEILHGLVVVYVAFRFLGSPVDSLEPGVYVLFLVFDLGIRRSLMQHDAVTSVVVSSRLWLHHRRKLTFWA